MAKLLVPTINILLIDDDDVATEGVLRSLHKCNAECHCVTASDGLEGLEILRGEHPGKHIKAPMLVLLDLNMPRMDGLQFLSTLRADARLQTTVVFVLTTSSRESDRLASYRRNVAGYMVKAEIGPRFAKLASLLDSYGQSILFPP